MNKLTRILGALFIIAALFFSQAFWLDSGRVNADGLDGTGKILPSIPQEAKGNPKLDSYLNRLVSNNTSQVQFYGKQQVNPNTVVRVIVDCQPGKLNTVTKAMGSYVTVEQTYGNMLQATVPVSRLNFLAALTDVRKVNTPQAPLPLSITGEEVGLTNSSAWQAVGYNGTGVKIGVLDAGFTGYEALLGTELPATVTAQSFDSADGIHGTTDHGTACAEIAYEMAPGAQFFLTNFSTSVEMGNAVNWLINTAHVNVITCSVGWPGYGPGDGTGTIDSIVNTAYAAGVTWTQAMGNQAQRHWQGTFVDNGSGWNRFSGTDVTNAITVSAGQPITAILSWDDTWGASANDYDLYLVDSSYHTVEWSVNTQDGNEDPYEGFSYTATYTGTYYIAIYKYSATRAVSFHLYTYYQNLGYQVAASSYAVPADSPNVISVGALPWNAPTTIEAFSSQGPTKDSRVKPDLASPDNVSNSIYNPFQGTSASAPCIGGAAALVKQRYPAYTPAQIQAFLEGRAVDLGAAGKDNVFGSGRLYLGTATDNFTLTMAVNGNGTVLPTLGSHNYISGTVVSINATPDAGWRFVNWTGNVTTVANVNLASTNVTMNANYTITANFDRPVLTMAVSGNGTVTPSIGPHTYDLGSFVNVTATPNDNWTFDHWSGNVTDTSLASTNVTMNTDKTVTAYFIRVKSTLTLAASGNGTVAMSPTAANNTYPVGTSVNITATPDAGWRFVNWLGDVGTVSNTGNASTNVTMNSDYIITALFTNNVTLTIGVSGSGTTNPSAGSYSYSPGTSVNITASPGSGWQFSAWTGNVTTIANVNSTSTNITMSGNYTIAAAFSVIDTGGGGGAAGGGGGGGGGGGATTNDARTTYLNGSYTYEGRLVDDFEADSLDALLSLNIPIGTYAKNSVGQPLSHVTVTTLATPDTPPVGNMYIGSVYDLGPIGATFDPPLKMTLVYDATIIPAGYSVNNLYLATWDDTNQTWDPVSFQLNSGKSTITASIQHFSEYALLLDTRAAAFSLSELSVNPAQIKPGENTMLSVKVANTGNLSGDCKVVLDINGSVQETKSVTVESGAYNVVNFTVSESKPGTYSVNIGTLTTSFTVAAEPASFKVESLSISPSEINVGASVNISVKVINTGGMEGKYTVTLKINTIQVNAKDITLAGSASQQVDFNATGDKPGKAIVEVNGLIGEFAAVTATSVTPIEASTPASTSATIQGKSTTANWPLIVGIAAGGLVVITGVIFIIRRRHGKTIQRTS